MSALENIQEDPKVRDHYTCTPKQKLTFICQKLYSDVKNVLLAFINSTIWPAVVCIKCVCVHQYSFNNLTTFQL